MLWRTSPKQSRDNRRQQVTVFRLRCGRSSDWIAEETDSSPDPEEERQQHSCSSLLSISLTSEFAHTTSLSQSSLFFFFLAPRVTKRKEFPSVWLTAKRMRGVLTPRTRAESNIAECIDASLPPLFLIPLPLTLIQQKERDVLFTRRSSQLIASLPPLAHWTLSRIVKGNASGWLTVLSLRQEGYDLTSTQFRDQLAIRYGHEPSHLPSHCDGCSASFTLQHALDCPKGGLIERGHNDIRDHDAKVADLAWGGVTVEQVLVPNDDRNSRSALQADWSARGVWEGNRVALFDNRIVDANAPSYQRSSWDAIARKAAEAKRKKYASSSKPTG